MKDGGYKYFIQILNDHTMQYEYRTMAVFVLSIIVNKYPKGQVSPDNQAQECLGNCIMARCTGLQEVARSICTS